MLASVGPVARPAAAAPRIHAREVVGGLDQPVAFTFGPGRKIWYVEKATGEVAPEKATGNVADSAVAPAAHAGTEADTRSGTAPTPPPDGGAIAPRPRRSTEGAQREARIPPPPDDPGVKTDESEEETAPGRFRLF